MDFHPIKQNPGEGYIAFLLRQAEHTLFARKAHDHAARDAKNARDGIKDAPSTWKASDDVVRADNELRHPITKR
jgi:hypothetical protein